MTDERLNPDDVYRFGPGGKFHRSGPSMKRYAWDRIATQCGHYMTPVETRPRATVNPNACCRRCFPPAA